MRKSICIALACIMILPITGCAKKDDSKATTAGHKEAIEKAQSLTGASEKHDFLMSEAQGFMSAGKYEDAAFVGEYITEKVSPGSQDARRLLRKAYDKSIGSAVGGN